MIFATRTIDILPGDRFRTSRAIPYLLRANRTNRRIPPADISLLHIDGFFAFNAWETGGMVHVIIEHEGEMISDDLPTGCAGSFALLYVLVDLLLGGLALGLEDLLPSCTQLVFIGSCFLKYARVFRAVGAERITIVDHILAR